MILKVLMKTLTMKNLRMKIKMSWKLYLDNNRNPKSSGWTIARTVEDAKKLVSEKGLPEEVSLDNDLGYIVDGVIYLDLVDDNVPSNAILMPTGSDFVKWLVEQDMDGVINIPKDFKYNIHSANTTQNDWMRNYFRNYLSKKYLEVSEN